MIEQSRYKEFTDEVNVDVSAYRKKLREEGAYDFVKTIDQLQSLSNKLSGRMLVELFGEQLGSHLWDKFVNESKRNLLYFLSNLTSEYKFFLLYELKTNELLFSYS